MSFTATGTTNSTLDEVGNCISITVLTIVRPARILDDAATSSCLLRRSAAVRGSTPSSSAAPRRCAPSGWPTPPRPACAACAPASGPARGPSWRHATPRHATPRHATPHRPADRRHRAGDQQPPEVTLTHLGDLAELRLPARRALPGHQAQPGRENPGRSGSSPSGARRPGHAPLRAGLLDPHLESSRRGLGEAARRHRPSVVSLING